MDMDATKQRYPLETPLGGLTYWGHTQLEAKQARDVFDYLQSPFPKRKTNCTTQHGGPPPTDSCQPLLYIQYLANRIVLNCCIAITAHSPQFLEAFTPYVLHKANRYISLDETKTVWTVEPSCVPAQPTVPFTLFLNEMFSDYNV